MSIGLPSSGVPSSAVTDRVLASRHPGARRPAARPIGCESSRMSARPVPAGACTMGLPSPDRPHQPGAPDSSAMASASAANAESGTWRDSAWASAAAAPVRSPRRRRTVASPTQASRTSLVALMAANSVAPGCRRTETRGGQRQRQRLVLRGQPAGPIEPAPGGFAIACWVSAWARSNASSASARLGTSGGWLTWVPVHWGACAVGYPVIARTATGSREHRPGGGESGLRRWPFICHGRAAPP